MNPFFGEGGRRAITTEIGQRFRERTGAVLVAGFETMVAPGEARCSADRVAGFMETHDLREWLVPLHGHHVTQWSTAPVPATDADRVALWLSIGFGNGSPLPQPSGHWELHINGRHAVDFRVVNHSQVWQEGPCTLAFAASRIETAQPYQGLTLSSLIRDEAFAAFGPALVLAPAEWFAPGASACMIVTPRAIQPTTRWFQVATAPGLVIGSDIDRATDLLLEASRPRSGGYNVYFGDTHTHSGQVREVCEDHGCGMGSREENYQYARRAGGLDFYALTDHEWQVDPDRVADYFGLADRFEEPGRFVCLPAYEHTSLLYGHRNIYFRDRIGPLVNTNREGLGPTLDPADVVTPDELWSRLEASGAPFISVPHHPSAASHPFALEHLHPKHDRLIEVYSTWGSSEYYGDFPRGVSDRHRDMGIQAAIRRGHRFGIIASADGHDGHPGDAQSPLVKHHHQFHFCGSGRAAVLADALTRASIFDALYLRRCYATTGPPIRLDVRVNGSLMGSDVAIAEGRPAVVTVGCGGSNGLAEVRIVKNGAEVAALPCHGHWEVEKEWVDPVPAAGDSYYVRVVQVDRESAWSSPTWVG